MSTDTLFNDQFKNPQEPEIYENVSNTITAEQLEAIIGCISGVLTLIVAIGSVIKIYYCLNYHCKQRPNNIRTCVVKSNDTEKTVDVTWENPERSFFQKFMCLIQEYMIECPCCKTRVKIHFNDREKARITLKEYREHKLQVTICYIGKIVESSHWSEPSELSEPFCVVKAAPSKPEIKEIELSEKNVPKFTFTAPQHSNGSIYSYRLSCQMDGSENQYIVYHKPEGKLNTTTWHVALRPSSTYNFKLAAVKFENNQEEMGEWSDVKTLNVGFGETRRANSAPWSTKEWKILLETVIRHIGNGIEDLALSIGMEDQEFAAITKNMNKDDRFLPGVATSVMLAWRHKYGQNASLTYLFNALNRIEQIRIADDLKTHCEREGIKLKIN